MIKRITFTKAIMILIIGLMSIVAVLPFYSMMVMGTYYINDLFTGIKMVPGNYIMQNMKTLFTVPIFTYYRNSILSALGSAFLCVIISSMCGYAISKYTFKMKKVLFNFVLLTLMIPTQLGLIAFMIEMNYLGLMGTLWPIILPNGASAFGVYWMTSYIKDAIPDEVIESARIDGCNEYSVFFRSHFLLLSLLL